jgi:hypothetical protein
MLAVVINVGVAIGCNLSQCETGSRRDAVVRVIDGGLLAGCACCPQIAPLR